VSKNIDKRSVARHAVKRKLADAVSFFWPRLGKNMELVFLAKQNAREATVGELQKEMEVILKRERLL
jgi:ribonuclease P protein component